MGNRRGVVPELTVSSPCQKSRASFRSRYSAPKSLFTTLSKVKHPRNEIRFIKRGVSGKDSADIIEIARTTLARSS